MGFNEGATRELINFLLDPRLDHHAVADPSPVCHRLRDGPAGRGGG